VTTLKIAYFVKSLPSKLTTFINHEIDYLRAQGHEVYLLPIWDADTADLSETVTAYPEYTYARFSSMSPGWVWALARFFLMNPRATARVFSDYRPILGRKFVLKSLEAALFLKRAGIDRIHAHTLSPAASRARISSLLLKIPYTVTVHGSDLLLFPPVDARQLITDAAFLITPTEYNKRRITFLTGGDIDTIRVIPSPVDTDFFRPKPKNIPSADTIGLITVGRLHPVKRHDLIIEAARLLRARNVDFTLTIVGGGELDLQIRRLVAELGLDDRIRFAGVLLGEDLRDRLAAADVFVMASESEGLPVSMLEAMAAGLAVVVPAITGIPEVIRDGKNGLLFAPVDPDDLARKLDSVISDAPLRQRLGREARQTALLRFGRATVYNETFRLICGAGQ
jgi:colanic acid/amylovoran biosynthesis glycosyltransferase